MPLDISFKRYRRVFALPMQTARGEWAVREGFVLRYEAGGHVGYGEVAPIPEFGTETVAQAEAFLTELAVNPDQVVPEEFPCCAFALSCAGGQATTLPALNYPVAALLPAGAEAVGVAAEKVAHGYRTLKWKVGVDRFEREQATLRLLVATTPRDVKIRLDANCGWSLAALKGWLDFLQPFRHRIEFIEQPLSVGQEFEMAKLSRAYGIAIALDESLCGAAGQQWMGAWAGPLVVKPALMGDVTKLLQLLKAQVQQVVISSAFETGIGLLAALRLADALPGLNQAIGFDTFNFADSLSLPKQSACITTEQRSAISPENIWIHLPHLT